MSITRRQMSEARLLEFGDAWNAHDVGAVMSFFTEDPTYLASFGPELDGTVFRGRHAVRRGVEAFLTMFPDGNYTDMRAVVHGDWGVAQWTFSGTRNDGERIVYRGVDVFEFEGDLIKLKDAFRKERAPAIGSAS